ncbi:unnamed protein product [Schistosoma mattheei]|uniref:Uncharacterized protein n=1 Tax=Schistosoma mattheei TaxID=31246 RepID=A0A183NYE9_9TREM|nr:unnamed protein product [Schistosoma mattheei]
MHAIQWTARNQLDDLDSTDHLTFLSQTHQQIQVSIASVAETSAAVGVNIHKGKIKIFKYNTENTKPIKLDRGALKEVKTFMYLDSIIDKRGGSGADVNARIDKAGTAFLQLMNIWNSKQLSESQYRIQNLQYEHQDSSTVRS